MNQSMRMQPPGSSMANQPNAPGQPRPPNPLHITFKDTNWPTLTIDNVLDYFCNSQNQFYDLSSNNQTCKMQNIREDKLIGMKGIQYVLWSAQPPLFVICKQSRISEKTVTPLAYYYIINGTVYQCPDILTYVQSRLVGAIEPLKKAFDQSLSFSRHNAAKGYYWDFKQRQPGQIGSEQSRIDDNKPEEENRYEARSTHYQRTRMPVLMEMLFKQFPPIGKNLEERPNQEKGNVSTERQEETGKRNTTSGNNSREAAGHEVLFYI
ncbi:hypothetical protein WR25_07619 [Diploscapter pachys]|uniref:Mediator of RNA polymerase II transcription subunit 6 n=1 Tax=Diploscapter pachys TaxID=2018661 RepID=A0A2A2J739_9BILA|nr:hypothetical protein WR25_07619 [Diploscapter pachys]